MPLIFGYERSHPYWTERFKELSEEQQTFFHNSLPFCMMGWDIGHISEDSIDEIVIRELHIGPYPMFKKLQDLKDKEGDTAAETELREILTPFIGFSCNVYTETRKEWIKKKTNRFMDEHFNTRGKIDKEHARWRIEMEKLEVEYEKENPTPLCPSCETKMRYISHEKKGKHEYMKPYWKCRECETTIGREEESNGNNDTPQD